MKQAYFWLTQIQGIGIATISRLVKLAGGIEELWETSQSDLLDIGVPKNIARRIINLRQKNLIEDKLDKIQRLGIDIISIDDDIYPDSLKNIYDPPFLLYAKGDIDILNDIKMQKRLWIAMVGTRKPSPYGVKMSTKLSNQLAQMQVGIVSGLASGIDGICHKSAIDSNSPTVAVLGNGCNIVYPKRNKAIYDEITNGKGILLSEFEPNTPPIKYNFPRRNRIISGLSQGVIVVEAGENSGSLITARYAMEQGRTVMCIPENVTSPLSKGGFKLLSEGAVPISTVEDVLAQFEFELELHNGINHFYDNSDVLDIDNLGECKNSNKKFDKNSDIEKTLALIEPASADQIANMLQMSAKDILSKLTYLEINGIVSRVEGSKYMLTKF